jgi:predicted kinase
MEDEELLARDVSRLRTVMPNLVTKVDYPSLIVLVGLPGSGKSYFASKLTEKIPAVVLESDFLRKKLVKQPVYSQFESFRLFKAVHQLIRKLLTAGYNVILDATNLSEESRRPLSAIAGETGAKTIVVHMNTPRDIAEARLSDRLVQRDGYSDADWAVYQQLEPGFEPIKGAHYEINRALDISTIIDKIVAEITRNT